MAAPVEGQDVIAQAVEDLGIDSTARSGIYSLIYNPLIACVECQENLALDLVNFVAEICFTKTGETIEGLKDSNGNPVKTLGEPRYLEFTYDKTSAIGMPMKSKLSVPLVCCIPWPVMRIDHVQIEFKAKIVSKDYYDDVANSTKFRTDSTFKIKGDVDSESTINSDDPTSAFGDADNSEKLSSLTTLQVATENNKNGFEVTKEFTYEVKVKAVADPLPEGMIKLLEVLTGAIQDIAEQGNADSIGGLLGSLKPVSDVLKSVTG